MKKILVILHTLSYTGSPRSAFIMSTILQKNGYGVDVWAYEEGKFAEEFKKIGITVRIVPSQEFLNRDIRKELRKYHLVIANTVCTNIAVAAAQDYVPTVWYIREAGIIPELIENNNHRLNMLYTARNIYTVSEYAQKYIMEHYNKNVRVIHNSIEDNFFKNEYSREGKIRIVTLGILNANKGMDLLIQAYKSLAPEYKQNCEIHFAGKKSNIEQEYVKGLFSSIEEEENIIYHGEITERDKVLELIESADVIAVVSWDESCSLVALEGLMMGKPVLVTDHVGAKYLITEKNGWIVGAGKIEEIKTTIEQIIDMGRIKLEEMGCESRKIYLETSTVEAYEKAVMVMIRENICKSKVLYNIRSEFVRLKVAQHKKQEDAKKKKSQKSVETKIWGVEPNKRIVLYGAGVRGKAVYTDIKASKALKIVCWADKTCREVECGKKVKVISPEQIKSKKFDYVLVAVKNEDVFQQIREELVQLNIPEDKILWCYKK